MFVRVPGGMTGSSGYNRPLWGTQCRVFKLEEVYSATHVLRACSAVALHVVCPTHLRLSLAILWYSKRALLVLLARITGAGVYERPFAVYWLGMLE